MGGVSGWECNVFFSVNDLWDYARIVALVHHFTAEWELFGHWCDCLGSCENYSFDCGNIYKIVEFNLEKQLMLGDEV